MKHDLIKTDNYLLVVEETNVPKIGKWYYNSDNGNLFVIVNDYPIPKSDIVISHLPLNGSPILKGVDLLPPLPSEEYVEKLAKEFAHNSATTNYEEGINVGKYQGYIEGYNKAKEKYKYTDEDLRKAMKYASEITNNKMKYMEDYIQSLSQPKMPIGFEFEASKSRPVFNGEPKTRWNMAGFTRWTWEGKYIYE